MLTTLGGRFCLVVSTIVGGVCGGLSLTTIRQLYWYKMYYTPGKTLSPCKIPLLPLCKTSPLTSCSREVYYTSETSRRCPVMLPTGNFLADRVPWLINKYPRLIRGSLGVVIVGNTFILHHAAFPWFLTALSPINFCSGGCSLVGILFLFHNTASSVPYGTSSHQFFSGG